MYMLGVLALGFYALKVPERYFPGKLPSTTMLRVFKVIPLTLVGSLFFAFSCSFKFLLPFDHAILGTSQIIVLTQPPNKTNHRCSFKGRLVFQLVIFTGQILAR